MELGNKQVPRIAWSEDDLLSTSALLKHIHTAGIGANDIKTVMRDICLTDVDLANTMLEELQYWSSHGNNSKS